MSAMKALPCHPYIRRRRGKEDSIVEITSQNNTYQESKDHHVRHEGRNHISEIAYNTITCLVHTSSHKCSSSKCAMNSKYRIRVCES
jgi:hypothetical protein